MRIGIDLGGTKIEVMALQDDGSILMRHRVSTPAGNYPAIVDAIADLVGHAEQKTGLKGTIGVASPGAISPKTGLIKNANSTALNGQPLDRDLIEKLGREIRLENDANCLALSEAVDGAVANANVVFGVIIGTGVGGGLVVNKTVLTGPNRIAGEWGHNPLPWASAKDQLGAPCYCGKTDCIETHLSGAGLARDYQARSGKSLPAQEIASAAEQSDAIADACLGAYQDRLARSLATVINLLDPDAIVLGGGLSNVARFYKDLPALVEKYSFSDHVATPIRQAIHGDSSGVRGAAWLWPLPSSQ